MSLKQKIALLATMILLFSGVVYWMLHKSNVIKLVQTVRVFSYPIELYGKVVDVEGKPIAGAKVQQSFTGKGCDCPEYLTTDENGAFYLSGKGSSVFIRTSKEGYYETEQSKGTIGYTVPSDRPPADDPNNPAIFVLRKHGEAELLVKYRYSWGIPRDGTPVKVDLIEGKPNRYSKFADDSEGAVIIRAWSPENKYDSNGKPIRYGWKFEINAPNGGFVERTNRFDFIAPETGYTETLTFEMPEGSKDWSEWKHNVSKELFARLPNGNYSRLVFYYRPGKRKNGDTFRIESYTNPSGSRNLEYDPDLEITDQ